VRPTLIRAPGIIAPALVLLLALNGVRAVAHEHAYIPKDLTDAHRELIRLFSPNGVAEIKGLKDEKDALTIPIGIELTNRWQLNSNSRLAKYFHRLGARFARHGGNCDGDLLGSAASSAFGFIA